jgi:hypothetical protein
MTLILVSVVGELTRSWCQWFGDLDDEADLGVSGSWTLNADADLGQWDDLCVDTE